MEAIILGVMAISIIGYDERHYDTFEFAQLNFKNNTETSEVYNNKEFEDFSGKLVGTRSFNQISSNYRFGFASYIYGQTQKVEDKKRELQIYGGYAGWIFEFNVDRYFSVGTLIGGGVSVNKLDNSNDRVIEETNYFGIASPYISLGLPITAGTSLNLTATSYFLSEPATQLNGQDQGYESPRIMDNKIGLEIVWSN
jgi:hypothetical protein